MMDLLVLILLIVDLCVHGIWESYTEALFNIRVVDTDVRSYLGHSSCDVLGPAEVQKKCKYLQACQDQHATLCVCK